MYDVNYLYEMLVDLNMFTEEELNLITCINGFSIETLDACLYARYGSSVEQFLEELEENDEYEYDDDEDEEEEE